MLKKRILILFLCILFPLAVIAKEGNDKDDDDNGNNAQNSVSTSVEKDGLKKDSKEDDQKQTKDEKAKADKIKTDKVKADKVKEDKDKKDSDGDAANKDKDDDKNKEVKAKADKAKEDKAKAQKEKEDKAKEEKEKENRVKENWKEDGHDNGIGNNDKDKKNAIVDDHHDGHHDDKNTKDKDDKAKADKAREDLAKEQKAKDDLAKAQKEKDDKEKADKAREDLAKEQKAKDDLAKAQKEKEDKEKADKAREDLVKEQKAKDDLAKAQKEKDDKEKADKAREDLVKEQKAKDDLAKELKAKEDYAREVKAKEDKVKEDLAKEIKAREDAAREQKAKEDKEREDKAREDKEKEVKAAVPIIVPAPLPPPVTEAAVRIESDPPGAEVYIDNKLFGITPFSKVYKFGAYQIEMKKNGYRVFKEPAFNVNMDSATYKASLSKIQAVLQVSSVPSSADVFLNGQSIGKTPIAKSGQDLGTYKLQIKQEGYITEDRVVVVDSENLAPINVTLSKESGAIKISCDPAGADVYIDNSLRGRAPMTISGLATGLHQLILKKRDFSDMQKDIVVDAGVQKDFSFTLDKETGIFSAASFPDNADLFLNGTLMGKTPLSSLPLAKGSYNLVVRKSGYSDFSELFNISAGGTITRNVTLVPLKATLIVKSDPVGAHISITGIDYGSTPFISENLTPGNYLIVLSNAGYKTVSSVVSLASSDKKELLFPMQAIIKEPEKPAVLQGYFSLQSVPSGVDVMLNSTSVGKTPIVTMLNPGFYRVNLSLGGYSNFTYQAVIDPAKPSVTSVQMKSLEVPAFFNSSPLGADVFINERLEGRTPLRLTLSSGNFVLRMEMTNYNSWSTNFYLSGMEYGVNRFAVLKKEIHTFNYNSDPSGAEVWYKNKVVGVTPFEFQDVKDGAYPLIFKKAGYRDYPVTYTVMNGEPDGLNIDLEPMSGNLLVTSDPAGTTVYVDGSQSGMSGNRIDNIIAGYHKIMLKKYGYYDASADILILDKQTIPLSLVMAAKPRGNMQINSMPLGANLTFDGANQGVTPKLLESIPEGTYLMKLKMKGYKTYSGNVNIYGNRTETFNAVLVEGSDCCLGGCFGGILIKPAFWYAATAILIGGSGYSWYKMEQARDSGKKSDFNLYRDIRDYGAIAGGATLLTGVVVNLAF